MKFLITFIFILGQIYATAQRDSTLVHNDSTFNNKNQKTNVNADAFIGLGGGTLGIHFSAGIDVEYCNNSLQLLLINCPNQSSQNFQEIALLYGYTFNLNYATEIQPNIGVGYLRATSHGKEIKGFGGNFWSGRIYEPIHHSTFGITYGISVMQKTSDTFGFGIGLYGNINSSLSIVGISLNCHFLKTN